MITNKYLAFEKLTISKLGEGLIDSLDNANNVVTAYFREKCRLINYLFTVVGGEINNSRLRCPDKDDIDRDEILLAYTFLLSSENNFNYNWSYLLEKKGALDRFFSRFKESIQQIVDDLNYVLTEYKHKAKVKLEFNDIFYII